MNFSNDNMGFPPVNETREDGLLAMGGDLCVERLLYAYHHGIFPWFDQDQPILWWSPDPRMVLYPEKFKVSKSLKKTIKSQEFTITFNSNFEEVIKNCATIKRNDQLGTWITNEMEVAYLELYELGHTISVEIWKEKELVGGLYGVNLTNKKVFCGESMFSKVSNASKVGFYYLVEYLKEQKYRLIDCQVYTEHLESLGAEEVPREVFMSYLI
jgi:leucyl/phenylalanyl-tRNA--protein transferase